MSEIKDINTELNDLLAGFAGSVRQDNPEAITPDAAVTGTVDQGLQSQEAPVEPPTAQETVAPVTPAKEEPRVEEEGPWSDWDAPAESTPATPEAATPAPDVVFNDLGKALGLDVKSKDDLVKAISAYKAEADRVKAYDNIPAELKKAIELANKGGDYLEFLKINSVDYESADPTELYEDYIIDTSADKNGNVDTEKVNEFLDALDPFEKKLRGQELQRRLVFEQKRRASELEQDAVRTREKHDAELKSALTGFTEIDGFKVNDNHRRELFDWISSGGIMKDLFYNAEGQFDAAKAAKVAFRNKYYEKLDAYHKTKIRNATKREILKDITNQDIVNPPKFVNPSPNRGYSIGDLIRDYETNLGK